jgi:hypothetical protein
MSGFSEIAATLAVATFAIWLAGVIAIKAVDHIQSRRERRRGAHRRRDSR